MVGKKADGEIALCRRRQIGRTWQENWGRRQSKPKLLSKCFQVDASLHGQILAGRFARIETLVAIERPKDNRKFGRRTVFKAAVIELDDGIRLGASVLDLSEGGAKLKLPHAERISGEFFLEIPDDDLIVRAKIVHVEGMDIGIQYIRPPRRLSWLRK